MTKWIFGDFRCIEAKLVSSLLCKGFYESKRRNPVRNPVQREKIVARDFAVVPAISFGNLLAII